jgi:hypothetical protein
MKSMMTKCLQAAALVSAMLLPLPAIAQSGSQVGMLTCDVSRGIGMIVMEKQSMVCSFKQANVQPEIYTGQIDEFGVALGIVKEGHLAWAVFAINQGLPRGALSGSYAGVGANASVIVGGGANVLVGGTGRSFSLQPLSLEGQVGINIAAGVTTVTLVSAP